MFDEDTRAETLRTLGRYASNPELSFSWYDAAVLSQKIRKTHKSHSSSGPHFDSLAFDRNSAPVGGEAPVDDMPFIEDHSESFPDFDYPGFDDIWIGDDPIA